MSILRWVSSVRSTHCVRVSVVLRASCCIADGQRMSRTCKPVVCEYWGVSTANNQSILAARRSAPINVIARSHACAYSGEIYILRSVDACTYFVRNRRLAAAVQR